LKVNWVSPSLTLAIPGGNSSIKVGTTSVISATVQGVSGALQGVPVTFTVNPAGTPVTLAGFNTNDQGVATAPYKWSAAGRHTVAASVTVNAVETPRAGNPLEVTVIPLATPVNFAMVNLSPSYGKYHVRELITLTATAVNGTNAPVAGISVSFSIWGIEPRATLRAAVSDANGIAITFRSLDAGKIIVIAGARNEVKTPVVYAASALADRRLQRLRRDQASRQVRILP
jgi:hypothetical protein